MVFRSFNWVCPFCHSPQTVTEAKHDNTHTHISISKHDLGSVGITVVGIACSNAECGKLSVSAVLCEDTHKDYIGYQPVPGKSIQTFSLRPQGIAKTFPDCIPQPLRRDYEEACAIKDLSPKAAATLARRCLQGMIRDFCGISKARLIDEINALKRALDDGNAPRGVSEESVEAIDHARSIGNIGAHMEKDINVIVDVDPGEAQILIELIENLFDEWYIERKKREERFAKVKAIAEQKALATKAAKEE